MGTEQEWRKRFEQQKRSGLSIAQWCQQQGLKPNRYYYWHKRVGEQGPEGQGGRFLRVDGVEPVELLIGEKLRVKIPANFDSAVLKRLLEILGC